MPRSRLGVALLFNAEVTAEIDGLRRALGEPERTRIPPHLTLVPPVNVREEHVDDAIAVLRDAAARTRPLRLALGPPATFLPENPVLYLRIGGDDLGRLGALRDAVFRAPLERQLSWPFVPHVTIADGIEPATIDAAVGVLAAYEREAVVESVHLLEEGDGHRWAPIAEARFDARGVVGRGAAGFELTLDVSDRVDAPTRRWLAAEWPDPQRPLAVTARRGNTVVGAATGWTDGQLANVSELFVAPDHRREGIATHLVAAFTHAATERGARRGRLRTHAGSDAERFYAARGWRREATYPGATASSPIVQMVRDL